MCVFRLKRLMSTNIMSEKTCVCTHPHQLSEQEQKRCAAFQGRSVCPGTRWIGTVFSLKMESESVSRSVVSDSVWPARIRCPRNFPDKNTGMSCCFLLQGISLTQGSNLGLLHCTPVLRHVSHQRDPVFPLTSG